MTTPEPSPAAKVLQRVLTVSRLNGWSVVVVAGLGACLSLLLGDFLGTFVGTLAAVAGWMEVRGGRKLRQRDPDGTQWLVRSQLLLLSVILVYCVSRLGSFDAETAMGNLTPDMAATLKDLGLERADILSMVSMTFHLTYTIFAVVSVFYQGGMALYYRRRTPLILEALAAPPPPPAGNP